MSTCRLPFRFIVVVLWYFFKVSSNMKLYLYMFTYIQLNTCLPDATLVLSLLLYLI